MSFLGMFWTNELDQKTYSNTGLRIYKIFRCRIELFCF